MSHLTRLVFCLSILLFYPGCEPDLPIAGGDDRSIELEELSAAEKAEFRDLRLFFVTYMRVVDPSLLSLPGLGDPENHLQLPLPETASREEFEGLKQGVNTLLYLNSYEDLSANTSRADKLLTAAGAPPLSKLLSEYRAHSDEILRRGYIVDDTEFYLVREIADENPEFYPLLERYEFGN